LRKLHTCLSEYNIDGLATNVDFLMSLASHPEFVAGNVDTDFIPRHYDQVCMVYVNMEAKTRVVVMSG
jgi:3-methylcrotonyl-CoA carboxylase alpha subunit